MPQGRRVPSVALRVLTARSLRGVVDGLISVILATYLQQLGFDNLHIGLIITGTLLGSALVTIALGVFSQRIALQQVLLLASALMIGTGAGFSSFTDFSCLLAVALIGTLNPSGGDVSLFLPAEQALLAQSTAAASRARMFAWYSVGGTLAAGVGSLLAGLVNHVGVRTGSLWSAERAVFWVYGGVGLIIAGLYSRLSATPRRDRTAASELRRDTDGPLRQSRRTVMHLAALFSLDSFGGGFAVQSLLVLWLHQRFDLSVSVMGEIFFAAGLVGAFSQFLSARLAARIGYVRTMVYTHLPANLFLVLAGIAPTPGLAITLLLLRAAFSQMDVPARQAYVMAVVPPEERAAAASLTNVPRSLASALSPLLAGWMLQRSNLGWPLICGGVLKAIYDLLLLAAFRHREPAD